MIGGRRGRWPRGCLLELVVLEEQSDAQEQALRPLRPCRSLQKSHQKVYNRQRNSVLLTIRRKESVEET